MKYISFAWWIAKYCDFLYIFLFVICLFTSTHKHTGGELLRTVKTFHWWVPTHRSCARAHNLLLNATLTPAEVLCRAIIRQFIHYSRYITIKHHDPLGSFLFFRRHFILEINVLFEVLKLVYYKDV